VATTFVLATKAAKRPSQHNPCHYTGYTPGRVRWQPHASYWKAALLSIFNNVIASDSVAISDARQQSVQRLPRRYRSSQ